MHQNFYTNIIIILINYTPTRIHYKDIKHSNCRVW